VVGEEGSCGRLYCGKVPNGGVMLLQILELLEMLVDWNEQLTACWQKLQ
jgi:hypothetical protein